MYDSVMGDTRLKARKISNGMGKLYLATTFDNEKTVRTVCHDCFENEIG